MGEFVIRMEREEMHGYHTQSVNILSWIDIEKEQTDSQGSTFCPNSAGPESYALRARDAAMISSDFAINYPIGIFIIVEPMKSVNDNTLVIVKAVSTFNFRRKCRGEFISEDRKFETIDQGEVVDWVNHG